MSFDPDAIFSMYGLPLAIQVQQAVAIALAEDVGSGDLTGTLLPEDCIVQANLLIREPAVLCGQAWFNLVFQTLDPSVEIDWCFPEGAALSANQIVCRIKGQVRSMLTAERAALNFLQTLSAVATRVRHYAKLVEHTSAKILDTRKTLPGLRLAQKYAVRIGGGANQRLALYDGILIKENHIAAAGSISEVLRRAFQIRPADQVQIEVETLAQLTEALDAGAKSILLDNFDLDGLKAAVSLNRSRAWLEASGGIRDDQIVAVAETGVDRISLGTLTKDIQAIDFSLRVVS